ncbi:MAG: amino acid adenylation domain-containing protein, partial [Chloroflexi bacterium]|nr:amino acid adenylation domain-containing protein [Chloroflexota bacterium]
MNEQFFGHTNFALAVEVELNSADGTLALRLEYEAAEFTVSQIESLAGYFERTLTAMAANPEAAQHQFSPLSAAERQQLLVDWNETETSLPDLLIHEWVAQIAEEMGEKTAVSYQNQQLTYAQLNQRANQLAHYLCANGVGPETLVAVYLNRSPEMVIAALAVLKAGGAYLPLDPTYPAERIHFMLEDANVDFLLTTDDLRLTIESPITNLICLDVDWLSIASYSDRNPISDVMVENAAYVIYTSGSTGRPKGVVVTHRGMPNLAQAQHKAFAIGPESRVLQFAAFGFDASVSEMFVTLTAGATLVLASAEAMMPGPDLAKLVQTQGVTAVTLPPSALAIMNPDDFPSLQTVVAAGEACSAEVVTHWAAGRRFVNGYGPTEATVCATTAVLIPDDVKPHIGRPLDNVQLLILNAEQQPVPIGTPGELYIGGIGIARGYLNRPALTAERFVDLRFNRQLSIVNRKFYRTGDLVRYLPNGSIEFLGRLDHQVKIRGYRIELGEIEAMLRRQTAVQDALVVARDDNATGLQLVAYVVGENLAIADLRTDLSQALPIYMIPAAFVPLNAFPLTPNGKIDRRALPVPMVAAVSRYVSPRNDVETVIANLWAETLNVPRVGINDNFFEMGGRSLLGTQLVTRMRQTLRIELPLRAFFNSPTVATIADVVFQPPNDRIRVEKVAQLLIKLSQLSNKETADKLELPDLLLADEGLAETAVPTILPRPQTDDPLPLSFAQRRLWFLQEMTPGSLLFNTPMALRLEGKLDESALGQACQALVERHENLRTTFTAVSGIPQQIVHDSWQVELHKKRVSTEESDNVLQTAVQQPFDLENGPLLRFHLLRLSPTEHILLLVFHHIIVDGWSVGIMLDELTAFYDAFCQNQQPKLPKLPIQYADYTLWQRDWLSGERLQTQLDYWQIELAGDLPLLQMPTDSPRPLVKNHNGAFDSLMLSARLSEQITVLCQQNGATPFMFLLAAFKVLLFRYTAQEDILVGTPIANRQQAELDGLVGFFVNTLVLRSQLDGAQSFRQLLAQVRQTATTAYDHQDVPFEKLVELIQPERNLSYDPLFQVMFTYGEGVMGQRQLSNLTLIPISLNNDMAQFDLTLSVSKENDQFRSSLNYNVDLFMPETVRRLLDHWQILLAGIVANPDGIIGELPLLTAAETEQIVVDWNQTEASLPKFDLVHELIAEQANNHPETTALIFGQQQMSYGELNGRSNQLARALQANGI